MKRAAVLGSPIAHSKSPALHRAAYAALGLDWVYDAVDVSQAQLPNFLASCGSDWVGLSLTMPLKSAVIPHLFQISETADVVRAANTVIFSPRGLIGDNTDVPGMVRALREVSPGVSADSATIIGGGATARSALAALARVGVTTVEVVVRRAGAVDELRDVAESLSMNLSEIPMDSQPVDALAAPIVISTVPGGAADGLVSCVPANGGVLLDVAYSPWPTTFAASWNGLIAGGLDLLLWQAVGQVELMTGMEAPVAQMRAALGS
jgi:shikimate dehydrogenase